MPGTYEQQLPEDIASWESPGWASCATIKVTINHI